MIRRPAPAPTPLALVVDPDPDTRALHAVALNPFFHVDEAEDGAEALARALARPPALVLTELRLPRVDGYTLCALLRREPATCGAAILVVTASAWATAPERARQSGADEVLLKPCRPDTVVERARAVVLGRGTETSPPPVTPADIKRGRRASRGFVRGVTTRPPQPPPSLRCPACDRVLQYDRSYLGGVSPERREQWDHYSCVTCGRFAYRQRTGKLRRAKG